MPKTHTPESVLFAFTPFSEVTPGFVGRRRELNALFRGFRAGKRLGLIVGTTGVGKTSLARVFCGKADDLFSGGITYAYAYPGNDLREQIQSPRAKPVLVVVDEAHGLNRQATQTLDAALNRHPRLNLLLVGQVIPELSFREQFAVVLDEFSEAESVKLLSTRLGRIDPDNGSRLYGALGGNPVALARAAFAVHEGKVTWDELTRGIREFSRPGILGPDGRPLPEHSEVQSRIILDVSQANEEILHMLRESPEKWHGLPPRKFEEVVAELLGRLGYTVELTPVSADGGFDMYAAKRDSLGEFLFLVECKRFVPPHKVGVEIVRSLQGVLSDHRANGAAIVTTSFFTAGAREFQNRFQHQLKLHDYLMLQKWLHMLD